MYGIADVTDNSAKETSVTNWTHVQKKPQRSTLESDATGKANRKTGKIEI